MTVRMTVSFGGYAGWAPVALTSGLCPYAGYNHGRVKHTDRSAEPIAETTHSTRTVVLL